MGELILCSHPIAAMPYYIDNISLNVYSLEELCYYIENHLYLIKGTSYDIYFVQLRIAKVNRETQ